MQDQKIELLWAASTANLRHQISAAGVCRNTPDPRCLPVIETAVFHSSSTPTASSVELLHSIERWSSWPLRAFGRMYWTDAKPERTGTCSACSLPSTKANGKWAWCVSAICSACWRALPMDLPLHANAPLSLPLTFRYPQCNHRIKFTGIPALFNSLKTIGLIKKDSFLLEHISRDNSKSYPSEATFFSFLLRSLYTVYEFYCWCIEPTHIHSGHFWWTESMNMLALIPTLIIHNSKIWHKEQILELIIPTKWRSKIPSPINLACASKPIFGPAPECKRSNLIQYVKHPFKTRKQLITKVWLISSDSSMI